MGRRYPIPDVKILFGRSAALCAFPECRRPCIIAATASDPEAVTGEIAHIAAHSNVGPRANGALTQVERDSYQNWILLCPDHHSIVDKQANTYSISDLQRWKTEHERWVAEMYRQYMPSVTFVELKVVALAILNHPQRPSDTFTITPPREKMIKNGLSGQSNFMLTLAIGKARDVEQFIEGMILLDFTYPERLKSGFLLAYNRFVDQGYSDDSLFQAMLEFSTGISQDFKICSAGLAVLGYMFEKCEVFEP